MPYCIGHARSSNYGRFDQSPLFWNNMKIEFPKEVVYVLTKSNNVMFWIKNVNNNKLHIFKSNTKFDINKFQKFIKLEKYKVDKMNNINFKGLSAYEISYYDNSEYNYYLILLDENIIFRFNGNKIKFIIFKQIIDDIEILD